MIKTKLVLQNEVAANRQREDQLREELRLKKEAKEKSDQFPRSCLQFDLTAEDRKGEKCDKMGWIRLNPRYPS